jgi:amino acid permease
MNDRTKYQTENKTARDMGIKLSRKIVYSILGATILALLIISPDTNQLLEQANGWIAVVIQYIIRVGMIIANFVMGIYNAKTIFNDNYLRPINNRIRMLDEYQIYKTENKWQSKADIEEEINKRVKEKVEPLQEMVNQLEQRQIQ